MKKTSIILAFLFVAIGAWAQDTTVLRSKKGIPILPKAGDWAIGVDASPYLYYVGNLFNGTSDNNLDLSYQNTIYGRYYIADDAAIRANVYLGNYKNSYRYYVNDDAAVNSNPLDTTRAKLEDKVTYTTKAFGLNVGYLKFRGYGRLRGFYGAFAEYGFISYKHNYNYANQITSANTTPSTSVGASNSFYGRILEYNQGNSHNLAVGLVAGIEYYILPKISLGGEVTLKYGHSWRNRQYTKWERWNGSGVETYNLKDRGVYNYVSDVNAGEKHTELSTNIYDSFNGGLYIMFHF
jgi:hypothetical protein